MRYLHNIRYRLSTVLFAGLLTVFGLTACDSGLEPPLEGDVTLRGSIEFVGGLEKWPPADSIFDLRVVAFQSYPPVSLVEDLLEERAWFTADSLAYFQESLEWEVLIPFPTPPKIEYLVVALQNGPNLFTDWIAVGVYALPGQRETPTQIPLQPGRDVEGLTLQVDFDDLPPQIFMPE